MRKPNHLSPDLLCKKATSECAQGVSDQVFVGPALPKTSHQSTLGSRRIDAARKTSPWQVGRRGGREWGTASLLQRYPGADQESAIANLNIYRVSICLH
jgi:hypothetical protein